MQLNNSGNWYGSLTWHPATLSWASQALLFYGALMWLACGLTLLFSIGDDRMLREVAIWAKPMKFMAATALFAWTTVWVTHVANATVTHGQAYIGICILLVLTSLFEVAYITYQAAQGSASHYNTSDPLHAILFGVMAVAAVALTASQGWLAWAIWKASGPGPFSVVTWGVITGLVLTFVLSTISGFMLGANQPPAGTGLPLVGWHLYLDVRPSHFLGVHAQQLIPLWGIVASRFFGTHALQALTIGSSLYVVLWGLSSWASLGI